MTLASIQKGFFLRVIDLQAFPLESKVMFTIVECVRLVFKDLFIVLAFLTPFPLFTDITQWALRRVDQNPYPFTITLTLLLTFLAVGYVYGPGFMYDKLKGVFQYFTIWLDLAALPGITISVGLARSQNQGSYMAVCNAICIAILFIFSMLKSMFRVSKHFKTNNLTHRRLVPYNSVANLGNLVVVIILSIKYDSQRGVDSLSALQLVVYSLIFLVLTLLKLKERIYLKYYIMDYSNKLSSFFYLMELNAVILVGIYDIFSLETILHNLFYLETLMTILAYLSLQSYLSDRLTNLYLTKANEVKEENEGLIFLDYLAELITMSQNGSDHIALTMIRQKHFMSCQLTNCYCQRKKSTKKEFFQQLVKAELVEVERNFKNSPFVLLSVLYFKVSMYSDYPQILANLQTYSTKFSFNIFERYFRQALISYVSDFIDFKNQTVNCLNCESLVELEGIKVHLETLILDEIELRNKQWKYFSRRICRVSELKQICHSALGKIKGILTCYSQNRLRFKKSKEFNLLLLFYFLKVSFFTKSKEVKNSLKQMAKDFKEEELHHLKEFKKFMYHKNCCAIESRVDTQEGAVITHTSRNIEDIFGRLKEQLLGQSVNALMPPFMVPEHEAVIRNWRTTGSWKTMGKLKEVYCVHKDGHCFAAMLYLKLIVKKDSLHLLTNVFELNSNDYLIIDSNMKIHGMGRRFTQILGEHATALSFDMLLVPEKHSERSLLELVEKKRYERVIMSLKEYEEETKHYVAKYAEYEGEKKAKLKEEFYAKLLSECDSLCNIEFEIKNFSLGTLQFVIINLKDASFKMEKPMTLQAIEEPPEVKPSFSRNLDENEQSSCDPKDNEEAFLVQGHGNSSMSSATEKENYPLLKIIDQFQEYLLRPQQVSDGRMGKWTFLIVFFLVLLVVLNFVSHYYYRQTLEEVKGIFAADGTVSNIMQTVEMGYNNVFVLRAELVANRSSFDSSMRSARLVQQFVYGLLQLSLQKLLIETTPLTNTRLYGYIQKPAQWYDRNGNSQAVQARIFIGNMYQITNIIFNHLEELRAANSTAVNLTYFESLRRNFEEMKRLNEFFLTDYQQLANLSHDLLDALTYILMGAFMVLCLGLGFLLDHYYRFRFEQRLRSFEHFTLIPNYFLDKMKRYYSDLEAIAIEDNQLSSIEKHEQELFQVDSEQMGQNYDSSKGSMVSKINLVDDDRYLKWIGILLMVGLLCTANFLGIRQVRDYIAPSKTAIEEITQLIRSQNQLFESYFELKAAYYLDGQVDDAVYTRLMLHMNQDELTFSKVSHSLANIFIKYDPAYKARIIHKLIAPVCPQAAEEGLSAFENDKCNNGLPLKLLDSGVIVAVNFMQRKVRGAIQDLHKQFKGTTAPYQGDYFLQQSFVEIDNMLVFMFKIFQNTQTESFQSYSNGITLVTDSFLTTISLIAVGLVLLGVLWVVSLAGQKRQLALLYGHLLLIPLVILKTTHRITKSMRETVEYTTK